MGQTPVLPSSVSCCCRDTTPKEPPLEVLVHELYRDVAAHGEVGDLGDPLVLAMQVGEAEQPGRILLAWILHTTNY